MSALKAASAASVERIQADVVDDTAPFFAPASTDMLDGLLGEYQLRRRQIDQLAALVNGDLGNVVHYFICGNAGDQQLHRSLYIDRLFQIEGAVHALDAAYWSKALALTDVYECMPQDRKNAWNEQLKNPQGAKAHHNAYDLDEAAKQGRTLPEWQIAPLPHFEEETVRATVTGLLLDRSKFLAEKVDGIFRALSGSHVTNAPEAFGKRFIIAGMLSSYGSWAHDRVGYLHDLRCVIAKFMGRDEPRNQGPTQQLVEQARQHTGEWVVVDGGALKLRVYKGVGTAHMEIHPEMAWRLNQVLAHLYPTAIPAEFRQKPRRKPKDVPLMGRPLPFAVLELLGARQYERGAESERTFCFDFQADKTGQAYQEACRVLASIGGTPERGTRWQFDYPYGQVLREILISGCIPDQQAHQFYPSPEKLADICADLAQIGESDTVLEPSAGQGDLAAFLPKDRTTCVEISPLHCAVLKARGFSAVQADFLDWACRPDAPLYDRVVMNPPFADGRAQAHVEHAAARVKPGGRMVAILPASARGKEWLGAGWTHEWSSVYANEFAGTSAAVSILTAVRQG
jgi:hypothetical protein